MYLKLNVIGSDSSGNCTFIWDSRSLILVDCGFSRKYINDSIKKLRIGKRNPAAVLLTHGHGDHIKDAALRDMVKKGADIYCSRQMAAGLISRYKSVREADDRGKLKFIGPGRNSIDGFKIEAFSVPHDTHCLGFNIYKKVKSGEKKITVATDIAHTKGGIEKYFADSDIIVIESNYDDDMLHSSDRPVWLKKRISRGGHLSNKECYNFISGLLNSSRRLPSAVILAHISSECNTVKKAVCGLKEYVKKFDPVIELIAARKKKHIDTVYIK